MIKTKARTTLKAVMNDGSVIDIGANTTFELTEFVYEEAEPSGWKSAFKLLKGALRYASGVIAKRQPQAMTLRAGSATAGIRGSYVSFTFVDGTLSMFPSIGTGVITFSDGSSLQVQTGEQGNFNFDNGTQEIGPSDAPDPIAAAAAALANNDASALAALSSSDQAMAVAVMMANADQLGLSDPAAAMGAAAAASSDNAALFAFVASALDPDNAGAIAAQIKAAAPAQADAIDSASEIGQDPEAAPPTGGFTAPTDAQIQQQIEAAVAAGQPLDEVLAALFAANAGNLDLLAAIVAAARSAYPEAEGVIAGAVLDAGLDPSVLLAPTGNGPDEGPTLDDTDSSSAPTDAGGGGGSSQDANEDSTGTTEPDSSPPSGA